MRWLLPALTLVFVGVLSTGLLLLRPRGTFPNSVAKPVQEEMERHPVAFYYAPLVGLSASAVTTLYSIFNGPIEARVTRAILAVIPLIGCLLLVRFRRWPK
jgi:hypothetical protein